MQGPARCILSIGPRVFGAMQAGQGLLEQQLGSSVVRSASGVITQGPAPSSSSTSERNTGKAGFRAAGVSGHRHFHASTGTFASADYYSILGISKDADDNAIKKAYYKLAKQYHPDTNKGNAEAASIFQEAQKAYETLRDPEKRRMYDTVGPEGMDRGMGGGGSGAEGMGGFGFGFPGGGGFAAGGVNMADVFEQFFGQNPAFARAFNQFTTPPVRLSFEEAASGVTRTMVMVDPRDGGRMELEVKIPPGTDTGDVVQTQLGMGKGRRTPVTVQIPIEVTPHPYFRREGADLYRTLELPFTEALLGCRRRVDTLDSAVEVEIPPCARHGDKVRVRGRGLFNPRRGLKGDFFIELSVVVPQNLSMRQRALLLEFQHEEEKKQGQGSSSGSSSSAGSSSSRSEGKGPGSSAASGSSTAGNQTESGSQQQQPGEERQEKSKKRMSWRGFS